jgi:hypothetical protein
LANRYRILTSWTVSGIIYIEADSIEEAILRSDNENLPHGEYVEDSFRVDGMEEYRNGKWVPVEAGETTE